MASSFEHTISHHLQCPICLELLSDPKLLSCTHTFCKTCLSNIVTCSSQRTANSISCPICRSITDVLDGCVEILKTNLPIKSIVDDVINSKQLCDMCHTNPRAVHSYCECGKNMCSTCLESHIESHPDHRVVGVDDLRTGKLVLEYDVYCREHPSERCKRVCTDVCVTCKKFICERCRLIDHKEKGHTVQSAEEYKASIKSEIESLQVQGNTKATTIKSHMTCIESQKQRINDHIERQKSEIHKISQESIKKINDSKASLDETLETQRGELCGKLDDMKDADEMLVTSIESASELVGKSLKAPLDDDAIRIHDSFSIELKNLLSKKDPLKKLAMDVTDRAEQIRILPNKHLDELDIGEVRLRSCKLVTFIIWMSIVTLILSVLLMHYYSLSDDLSNVLDKEDPKEKIATDVANHAEQLIFMQNKFVKCVLKCDVALSKKCRMNSMTPTPDGGMAVGYYNGGIDMFTADGQLQQTVLKDIHIFDIGFLSNGQYVVLDTVNDLTLYTQEQVKLNVKFETLSRDEGGIGNLAVDSNDLIYVSYQKAKKIQVFSPAGGKAFREIPCNGFAPRQITSYKDLLIVKDGSTIRLIDKKGNIKHKVDKPGLRAFAAVTQNETILIAWVKHDDGLVSIDEYTNELKHIKTLISDQKIEKSKRNWYSLQEFQSGEIAFCTPDRLCIFKLTFMPINV